VRSHLRLARVGGIPVGLNWSVLAVLVLLVDLLAASVLPEASPRAGAPTYWGLAVAAAIVFLATLLAHELAHALVCRHYDVPVKGITLWMLGGVTEIEGEPATWRQQLLVAVAGPLTSLGLGGLFVAAAFLARTTGAAAAPVAALTWLGWANLILGAFNLLPGAPLDGGRVLQALLWWRTGDRVAASVAAATAGRMLGTGLTALGIFVALTTTALVDGLWLALIGWFLLGSSSAEQAAAQRRGALGPVTVEQVMTCPVPQIRSDVPVDAALREMVTARRELCRVVDDDGCFFGLVGVEQLLRLTPQARQSLHTADVAHPVERFPAATGGEPLARALDRLPPARRADPVLVLESGVPIGLLTPEDLLWAHRRAGAGMPVEGTTGRPGPGDGNGDATVRPPRDSAEDDRVDRRT
jgi:Zn-dependent protease/predicted transcriptional regulator